MESPFFLGRTINNDPFSFSVHEGIIYSWLRRSSAKAISCIADQSSGTGLSFFFLSSACQMTPAALGREVKGVKQEQWLVSEMAERVEEGSEWCKERYLLEVG